MSFRIGLYAAEARLLREYLVIGLGQILLYRPDEKVKEEPTTDDKEAPKASAGNESHATPASPSEETPVF